MAGWDEDSISKLKQYYSQGMTMSQIASHLKGFSRNAVVGKIHRLNLELRGHPKACETSGTKKSSRPKRPTFNGAHIVRTKVSKPLPPEPEEPKKRLRERLGKEFDNDEYFAQWVSNLKPPERDILKIPNSGECKWITGSVREPNSKWCRQPVMGLSSWCPHHYGLVYTKPVERVSNGFRYKVKRR